MNENVNITVVDNTTVDLISLEDCKHYVKYEVSEEEMDDPDILFDINNLNSFRLTAIKYLENATGKKFAKNPIAKTFALIMVNELFENFKGREKNDVSSTKNLLLEQLKYDEEL